MSPLFVAHDIGGAQLLFSYIVTNNIQNYFILAEGPALNFFPGITKDKYISKREALDFIQEKNISEIITGTGWGSEIEVEFIQIAKRNNIKSITFLDHWVYYRERFRYPNKNWEENIPDELWTHDEISYNLAIKTFPKIRILKKENYFFLLHKKNWKSSVTENTKTLNLLFLLEPIGEQHKTKLGYDEFDALHLFFEKIKFLTTGFSDYKITLRPHPSERDHAQVKYQKYLNQNCVLSSEDDLFIDLAKHQAVLGCDTIAMYYANLLGLKVYCALPLKTSKCTLPIENLIYLNQI